jgi:16S rRNA C1402 (ribose-2'-O) methylase RsmI
MTPKDRYDRHITLINVSTVIPEKQATAATKITEIYENFVRNQSGFVAAEIQKSLDGTTVIAIARWQSKQALTTMQQNLEFQNLVKILDGEIIHAEPQIYEKVASIN